MDISQLISTAQDAITVRRVYGEPYEKDGVTVIPAARVAGGVGGGQGQEQGGGEGAAKGQEGEGGGFGVHASPAGAFVVKDGSVRWVPALDPQRALATIGVVAVAVVVARSWVRTRAIKAGAHTG
jgi:uncharacterized spore protein YtfJ